MLLSILIQLGCTPEEPSQSTQTKSEPSTLPNVVFITMDTTRKDRLGTYGYTNAKSDRIDTFADHGYQLKMHIFYPVG